MSKANDLLNTLSSSDISLHIAGQALDEEHVVIDDDRFVTVPDSLKRIAVQWDHDIETVTFDCPRYWDGHDLSKMAIYINYLCPSGALGSAVATNVIVDESNTNLMHFDWTISNSVTVAEGYITFLVCAKTQDADGLNRRHWNSEINKEMYVSAGLELPDDFVETHPDILTQVLLFNQNILELQKTTMQRSAVYVGSGEVPDGYDVQIDPNGDDVEDDGTIPEWPIETLPFTEDEISGTISGAGFAVSPTNFNDGKTYFRYHAGPTNFTWTNPSPKAGAVTIKVLAWKQWDKDSGGYASTLNIGYSDGTSERFTMKNGEVSTFTTNSSKTLSTIKGNYDLENWVVLDMSVMSITTANPAPANSTGTAGQMAFDSNYIYICTATNTWKRAALSSWT